MKSVLLTVTLYSPPKVEGKKVSDWLLEYVLAVLKWYGNRPETCQGCHFGHRFRLQEV